MQARVCAAVPRVAQPLPDISAFVVDARDSIPVSRARVTTTVARGRGRATQSRGMGSKRKATDDGTSQVAKRGRRGGKSARTVHKSSFLLHYTYMIEQNTDIHTHIHD